MSFLKVLVLILLFEISPQKWHGGVTISLIHTVNKKLLDIYSIIIDERDTSRLMNPNLDHNYGSQTSRCYLMFLSENLKRLPAEDVLM